MGENYYNGTHAKEREREIEIAYVNCTARLFFRDFSGGSVRIKKKRKQKRVGRTRVEGGKMSEKGRERNKVFQNISSKREVYREREKHDFLDLGLPWMEVFKKIITYTYFVVVNKREKKEKKEKPVKA